MNVSLPDWLKLRNGSLRSAVEGHSQFVILDGEPQYKLTAVPVTGKHGCWIIQCVNGRPLPAQGTYATVDEALNGGLEELRKSLGW
jgi:hypothetical protein